MDALFDGEPPPPPIDAGPRILLLQAILAVALPLDLAAVLCCTGVPGAALTLWAYLMADAEVARVDAGRYASADDAARVLRLRAVSGYAMAFTIVSFLVQIFLFATGRYDQLWVPILQRILG